MNVADRNDERPSLKPMDDPSLLKAGELAKALNVKPHFVRVMRHYGFKMPMGRATVKMAIDWLTENAEKLDGLPSSD